MPERLDCILKRAEQEELLTQEETAFLLELEDPGQQALVFKSARDLRTRYFDDRMFLYGFVYLSTYCRNDCRFCFYRRSNRRPLRYRQNEGDIVAAARKLSESGVHLIDLTLGEDPYYVNGDGNGRLVDLVREVRRATELPVMVSPGVLPDGKIQALARAGASWYACYQETFSQALFERLRPDQSYRQRLRTKQAALESGLLIEEGLLCGLGESREDLALAVSRMGRIGASQMRAMTFVPQPGTPMGSRPVPDFRRELMVMAVLRLVYPRALIPASLDVAGLDGLRPRLDAGANVVTSIVPPGHGLSGVAHPSLDIADARRTTASVRAVLTANHLQAATAADYRAWIGRERRKMLAPKFREKAACASL